MPEQRTLKDMPGHMTYAKVWWQNDAGDFESRSFNDVAEASTFASDKNHKGIAVRVYEVNEILRVELNGTGG